MQSIIITGANGQLGQELQRLAKSFPTYTFHFFSRKELDIADAAQVQRTFEAVQPAYCINCAAYTAVDKAESEQELAFLTRATFLPTPLLNRFS